MKAYTPEDGNTWPGGALYPVCTLRLPVAELAARVGVPLDAWEEDGMGDATGFCAQLAAGPWVLVTEYAHSRREHQLGPRWRWMPRCWRTWAWPVRWLCCRPKWVLATKT